MTTGLAAALASVVDSDLVGNANRGVGFVEDAAVLGAVGNTWRVAGVVDNVNPGAEVSGFLALSSLLDSSALSLITGSSAVLGVVDGTNRGAGVAGLNGTDVAGVTIGAGTGAVGGASEVRFFSALLRAS